MHESLLKLIATADPRAAAAIAQAGREGELVAGDLARRAAASAKARGRQWLAKSMREALRDMYTAFAGQRPYLFEMSKEDALAHLDTLVMNRRDDPASQSYYVLADEEADYLDEVGVCSHGDLDCWAGWRVAFEKNYSTGAWTLRLVRNRVGNGPPRYVCDVRMVTNEPEFAAAGMHMARAYAAALDDM